MIKKVLLPVFALLLFVSPGFAQSITLVKDIVPGSGSSSPEKFISANGLVFFSEGAGYLWSTDGTDAGTHSVGPNNMAPNSMYASAGTLFISGYVNTPNVGTELYKFDQATGNYVLVKDINVTTGGASSNPSSFTNLGATLYFAANDGVNGGELWKTDGTTSGTVLVKDINPGSGSSFLGMMGILNNILYFSAYDPINGVGIWKSDGTTSGTVLVIDLDPASNALNSNLIPQGAKVAGNLIYFSGYDAVNGKELWYTDGTMPGTYFIKDINPGTANSSPGNFIAANGLVYFTITNQFASQDLWVTDGTAGGTIFLKQFLNFKSINVYNNTLYVLNQGPYTYTPFINELWTSDGTVLGTSLVSNKAFVDGMVMNGQFYKVVSKAPSLSGVQIQKSLGSDCKTKTVVDMAVPNYVDEYIAYGTKILFSGGEPLTGLELYIYDTSNDAAFSCQSQSITFSAIPNQQYKGTYDLTASASSSLPISYTIDGTIATLAGNKLTFTGLGTFNVKATQTGNDLFEPAAPVVKSIVVTKSDQTISFPTVPAQEIVSSPTLNATASSGLAVSFGATPLDKVTLVNTNKLNFLLPGKITVTASQAGNSFYNAAPDQSQIICVSLQIPIISSDGKPDGATLTSSDQTGNQWYKDGSPISGATSATYKASESGSYTVESTIEGCASGKSSPFSLVVTGIESQGNEIQLFPNPSVGQLTLKGVDEPSDIRIIDLLGKSYYSQKSQGQTEIEIDLKDMPSGLYLIEIIDSTKKEVHKFARR